MRKTLLLLVALLSAPAYGQSVGNLRASNNLSDVASPSSSLSNLVSGTGIFQFALSQSGLGTPTGTMSGYVAGDTVTLSCTGVTFSISPIIGITHATGGAADGATVSNPGATSGNIPSGPLACSQASTTGSGTGFQITADKAVIAAYLYPAGLSTGGTATNGNFFLNSSPLEQGALWPAGSENSYLGVKSGFGLGGISTQNLAVGHNACGNGGSGAVSGLNVCVGADAGRNFQAAAGSTTLVGAGAGRNIANGWDTFVGAGSGGSEGANTPGSLTGYNDTAVGYSSGPDITSGSGNLFAGAKSGTGITTGGSNIILEATAGGDNCGNGNESNVVAVCAGAGRVLTITGTGTPSTSVATFPGALVASSLAGNLSIGTASGGASPRIGTDSTSGLVTANGNLIGFEYGGKIGQQWTTNYGIIGGCPPMTSPNPITGIDTALWIVSCQGNANSLTLWNQSVGQQSATNYKDRNGYERAASGEGHPAADENSGAGCGSLSSSPCGPFADSGFFEHSNIFTDGIWSNFHIANTKANSGAPSQFVEYSANADGTTSINVPGGAFYDGHLWYAGTPVLTTNANGAVSVQRPDSTSVGGNARGANAYDFQALHGSAGQVASGVRSFIAAGESNTASGVDSLASGYNTVALGANSSAFGSQSQASGIDGFVSGKQAIDRGYYNRHCQGGGYYTNGAQMQLCNSILTGSTTTTATSRLTADQNVASSTNCINLPNGTAYALQIDVMAFDKTAVSSASWNGWTGILMRGASAAATTWNGTSGLPTYTTATFVGLGLVASADTTNGCLSLVFTPPNSNTDTWDVIANVRSVETQ